MVILRPAAVDINRKILPLKPENFGVYFLCYEIPTQLLHVHKKNTRKRAWKHKERAQKNPWIITNAASHRIQRFKAEKWLQVVFEPSRATPEAPLDLKWALAGFEPSQSLSVRKHRRNSQRNPNTTSSTKHSVELSGSVFQILCPQKKKYLLLLNVWISGSPVWYRIPPI